MLWQIFNLKVVLVWIVLLFTYIQPAIVLSSEVKTMETENKEYIIIMGASYARGWNPDTIAGYPVVNKGMNGQETHEVLARFDDDIVKVSPRPRAVVLWGFINDIFRSSAAELEKKKEKTRENLQIMINKAQAAGIQPIIATEVTIAPPPSFMNTIKGIIGGILGKESYQDMINKHVIEINDWLEQQAQQQNLRVLDFEKVLAASDGRRKKEYVKEDGSHITQKAYDALTAYANQKLPKLNN